VSTDFKQPIILSPFQDAVVERGDKHPRENAYDVKPECPQSDPLYF
jgi:hypothetical protein